MFRLFARIPKGLDPVADGFKRHVESEGLKLVKEVTEAALEKKEAGGMTQPLMGEFQAGCKLWKLLCSAKPAD